MNCERCNKGTVGYNLHDYCATCGKNLCVGCMANGCCGKVPAESGQGADCGGDEDAGPDHDDGATPQDAADADFHKRSPGANDEPD